MEVSVTQILTQSLGDRKRKRTQLGKFKSLLNTNLSENSGITAATSRAINSEISSQMSRKLEEMKSDLNSHILNVIDSAIEEKVILSIRNANSAENTNLDLQSDEPHPRTFGQERLQRALRSNGLHQEIAGKTAKDAKKDFPRLVAMSSNRRNHHRENSVDSRQSDVEEGYEFSFPGNLLTILKIFRPYQSSFLLFLEDVL